MEPTTIAIDLAKRVFQIHYVDPATGAIHSEVLNAPSSCRTSPTGRRAVSSWKQFPHKLDPEATFNVQLAVVRSQALSRHPENPLGWLSLGCSRPPYTVATRSPMSTLRKAPALNHVIA
ncbi:hypothetical protein PQQ65_33890 [Paraburkholderia strydomiana]|jgi:hypothetical protein|uniref:Transposase IS111A/IS1328/IS1533 N-terminal domain-containing protein n=1 Tax=Paraburkholderia strydomiana TaxID=1245417 RepID=A0ABW9CER1_9BURK